MSDDRDFFELVSSSSLNRTGEGRGPADIENSFHLYGPGKRSEAMDQLDQAFADCDPNDLRTVNQLGRLRRNLRGINGTLIKAGR